MNTIQYDSPIIEWLQKQGIDFKDETLYRFKAEGMMDLIVEIHKKDGSYLEISISHVGEQNGDLMHDPEINYLVDTSTGKVVPEYLKNDYTGLFQQGRKMVDGKIITDDKITEELIGFTKTWAENIIVQGYERKDTLSSTTTVPKKSIAVLGASIATGIAFLAIGAHPFGIIAASAMAIPGYMHAKAVYRWRRTHNE